MSNKRYAVNHNLNYQEKDLYFKTKKEALTCVKTLLNEQYTCEGGQGYFINVYEFSFEEYDKSMCNDNTKEPDGWIIIKSYLNKNVVY